MNVLFLTSTFPRRAGDQQAPFVLEQARAWAERRPGDRLFILAPHDAGAARQECVDGIEVHRYRYMPTERGQTLAYPAILPNIRARPARLFQVPPFLLSQFFAARRLAREAEIDLVYAHWVMPQGLVALVLNRLMGLPYVLQNHSSDLSVFAKFGAPGRAMARVVLRRARAFFCVNSDQARFAASLAPELEPIVLPMGVTLDPDAIRQPETPEDARYGLGTISRLSKKKGIQHLIDAADLLAAKGRDPRIGIAGDGEDAAELKVQAKRAEIAFPGFLTGDDKLDFFSDCHAMAFASVDAGGDVEGMPVSLLEALVCGKPAIASRATNIALLPEWDAISGDVEFLEDPANTTAFAAAIDRVLALTPEETKTRSARLRKTMSRYLWDRLIDDYLAIIDRAIRPD